MHWMMLVGLIGCSAHRGTTASVNATEAQIDPVIAVQSVGGIQAIQCTTDAECTVFATEGNQRFEPTTGELVASDAAPLEIAPPWPEAAEPSSIGERWNLQIKNLWRSPFQAHVPNPNGGSLRLQRGLTPGTSRVVRLGGASLTARQAPDPGPVAYPNALALHPTGTEAYLVVWPNPQLIAFNARTMETTWRTGLGGPAQGLFVSRDGRYLIAESGGIAPEHQLLDYEPLARTPPTGIDPAADASFGWLERPKASGTLLVDLAVGRVVATLPGPFIGFAARKDGAVIASDSAIASVRHLPTESTP